MTRFGLLVVLAIAGCARPKEETKADTPALSTIDTLKPAPTDTIASRDSVTSPPKGGPGASTPAKSASGGKTTQTPTAKDTTRIGRDVAVPFDPTKRRLPTVDTTKRRPPP